MPSTPNSKARKRDRPRAVCILGPTATGKTAAALAVARLAPSVVINFDSRQVYRDFPIVTAQPDEAERTACPHRLYGFLDTQESVSAARYAELARQEIAEAEEEGRIPVLVGGTGLYLRALVRGLADIPDVSEAVRSSVCERIAEHGSPAMHERLAEVDPEYAATVHPNNRQRVGRALEVFEATGKPFSAWHAEQASAENGNHLLLGISLDLAELTPRLDDRIGRMLEVGALGEVARAWDRCPNPDASGWTGIGCAELLQHHLGRISLDLARRDWARNTRAYAKRQITWFNKEPGILWHRPGEEEALARRALAEIKG